MTPVEIGPSQDCTFVGTICSLAPVGMKRSFCYQQIIIKSMFFELSADIKFIPINPDLVLAFGDFVLPIRQV